MYIQEWSDYVMCWNKLTFRISSIVEKITKLRNVNEQRQIDI